MKTLDTIQKLSKLGKILSKIVFVICLVGGILCAVGLISTLCLPESLKVGGVTIRSMIEKSAETSKGTMYASLVTGILLCVGEAALAKVAETYFRNELAAGTPFTFDGARALLRLGICAICIPLGTRIAAEIVYRIMARVLQDVAELQLENTVSLGLGIMMIIGGLLCRHGAELARGTGSRSGE